MIDFSSPPPNLRLSFNSFPQFYTGSLEFNNFHLFHLLSQTLTVSISTFKNKAKNQSKGPQLLQYSSDPLKIEIQANDCQNLNLKSIFQQQKQEEKAIIQFQNSIQKSTQNIKEEQSEVFKEQKIYLESSLDEQTSSHQKLDFVNFQIECPKIGIKIHEILERKQRLMKRRVTDWNRIIKKQNMAAGYHHARQIRMLFL